MSSFEQDMRQTDDPASRDTKVLPEAEEIQPETRQVTIPAPRKNTRHRKAPDYYQAHPVVSTQIDLWNLLCDPMIWAFDTGQYFTQSYLI